MVGEMTIALKSPDPSKTRVEMIEQWEKRTEEEDRESEERMAKKEREKKATTPDYQDESDGEMATNSESDGSIHGIED